jgi:2,4-dienoyl-CoA reductase (NADPH2)
VHFKNRVLRSSIGGQLAAADGHVTDVWTSFEKRFARTGVAALISATVSVSPRRYSPIYYPHLAHDGFVRSLRAAVAAVKEAGRCNYILQIGDPGYHTQTSLLPQEDDARSASWVFDLLYGYRNHAVGLREEEIAAVVASYGAGARRAREAGCDGVEITASKGYLIHQFLNPATNRRRDGYGGSLEKRMRFLREVITAVRDAVGRDFLLGVRLSARDHNFLPVNLRLPPVWPLRHWLMGNDLAEYLTVARMLEAEGVDYLHISNGFGFINPKESPGHFPVPEVRRVFNASRHLSLKAQLRATLVNLIPAFLLRLIFGIGWGTRGLGANGRLAAEFKRAVRIPIIANGGFQDRRLIEETLGDGRSDLVSMARPLLANPDLLEVFRDADQPPRPCTFCNRCSVLTAVVPVGCYEPKRYASPDEMEADILKWAVDPDDAAAPARVTIGPRGSA